MRGPEKHTGVEAVLILSLRLQLAESKKAEILRFPQTA